MSIFKKKAALAIKTSNKVMHKIPTPTSNISMWDYLFDNEYLRIPKGPTKNKYVPHQGKQEMKRRLTQRYEREMKWGSAI
ncbi:MAG: hypothetical protein JKY23_06845 [Nitrospinaceae bacterium]|nr:hypothetical protein [Nitrospinaceae bacterium]